MLNWYTIFKIRLITKIIGITVLTPIANNTKVSIALFYIMQIGKEEIIFLDID